MAKDVINLTTSYIYDADLRIEANRQGKNYWYEYIKEMNEQLGLRAEEMSRNSLEDAATLNEVNILFIGDLTEAQITETMKSNLDAWVKSGGVLIGFGTEGLDEIFGNSCDSITPQTESDYTISGYFDLRSDPLTTDVHSYLHPEPKTEGAPRFHREQSEQKLIIFSNIRNISPGNSTEIARLYGIDETDTGYAAITKRDYHNGHAYYFAFNVPQTIWVLHQGIPITHDRDGDGYYRTGDLIAIGDNEREVLYADEILFLIQNMLAQKPQPLIYQMPPKACPERGERDDQIPDALFYWGGDDEAAAGTQVWASNWMKEKGLPYHINIMPNRDGKFAMTAEEAKAILANGHECSLHYNFWDNFNHPCGFTESDVRAQAEAFYQTFGFRHVCSVNHCVRWSGWAEPAKWMRAVGGRADNSFIHHPLPPMNPANRLGFVFGTSYPFYFYDNYIGENRKIDFLEEPITAYEVGYSSSETTDFDSVHKVIDIAAKYHLVMDMFYHPVNIYRHPACREAIEEALRYIDSKGIIAVHKGNDGLWEWWDKRSRSQIADVTVSDETVSFTAVCESDEGMIVKVPLNTSEHSVMRDGRGTSFKNRFEFGRNWLYVIVPKGKHKITISTRD
ncbi:TPA: hypothetical protein EYP66_04460 [Candidatus Poribacteria bacterium]|nr:hypothetical protein [Candidatus Poribacteria bacterium]